MTNTLLSISLCGSALCANINTELGVLIEDKALAKSFHNTFDNSMLNVSYRVRLKDNEQLM
ncbi:MAG: hypothetical protein U1E91_06735 [Moraxella sp.]